MRSWTSVASVKFIPILLSGALSLLWSPVSTAQAYITQEPIYDVYQLSAQSQIEVDNDLMVVTMVAQDTGSDSAELANKINATMGWAVSKLKPFTAIKSQTQNYQTYPQYERNRSRIKGWTASQTLVLETDNFEQAGKAIQVLQERMQVQGMQMSAKPETRKKAEDQLINSALQAFKDRALLVQTNMGAPAYRIMNLSIDSNGHSGVARYDSQYRSKGMEMSVSETPAIQGGTSTVMVNVSGQIQLE